MEQINRANNSDLLKFIPLISKNYESPKHLKPLTDELNLLLNGETDKHLLISIPPRHGKTETLLHLIGAYLKLNPTKTVAYMSYSQTRAESKSTLAMSYALKSGIEIDPKMQNRNEWRTKKGGKILTTSISGGIEGEGVDLFIIDDPVKNQEEAMSLTYREKLYDFFTRVAENRLTPNGSMIVCMHRWHQDDLIGRILERQSIEENATKYKYIRLPAIADTNEYNREIGTALWETTWSLDKLIQKRYNEPHNFSTEYQGIPIADEDRLIKNICHYDKADLPKELFYHVGTDMAYSIKTSADESAYGIIARTKDGNDIRRWVIEVKAWKKQFNDSVELLKELQKQYNVEFVTENNGVQLAIYQQMEDKGLRVSGYNPVNDKLVRSLRLRDAINAGHVMFPKPDNNGNGWVLDCEKELYEFTGINDKKDNRVDALTLAYEDSINAPSFAIYKL